jgi:hypothetical protein
LFSCTAFFSVSQLDSIFYRKSDAKSNEYGALCASVFWQEDSLHYIIDSSFQKAFKRNVEITLCTNTAISSNQLKSALLEFSSSTNDDKIKSKFHLKSIEGQNEKILVDLKKDACSQAKCIVFKQNYGQWTSHNYKNVLYFNVYNDGKKTFSHSNDTVELRTFSYAQKANGHYLIKRFWNDSGAILSEQIFSFNGDDYTSYFISGQKPEPKRILIFSNGYRGPKKNRDISDNLLTQRDRYRYWLRLDKAFLNRIEPNEYYYIDGNNSINTSNHNSMRGFSTSYSRIRALSKKERNAQQFHFLNTTPNDEGFKVRKESGRIAAKAYLSLKCNSPACLEIKDTLDIVSQSMGYAYSLGFIEEIKNYVVLGKMYIIAPENACADAADWSIFEEVWQYGSNLDQENPDPVWQQDGIAPQCEVKNIHQAKIGGRVFLPKNEKRKNFINSHMLNHYRWIFQDLKIGDNGYVK